MKIRTIYFKVPDVKAAATFWQAVLQITPHKDFDGWKEFMVDGLRLGLLLNDFDDTFTGSGCVPVFEFADDAVQGYIERAVAAGATILVDGLNDPKLLSCVMQDPFGHEFELSKFHA